MTHHPIRLPIPLIVAAALLSSAAGQAGDTKTAGAKVFQYTATVAGIICDSCEKHVREALSKLPGVSKVEIKSSDDPGRKKLIVTATSANLEKSDAVESLGDYAAQYTVMDWKKEKP